MSDRTSEVHWVGGRHAAVGHAVPARWRWSPGCTTRAVCGTEIRPAWPGYLLPPGVCPDCRARTGTAPPLDERRPAPRWQP
ncbi:hypothetical protein OOZ19_26735 [Saccharopolyspora sp. NFXS83]|uniref:hypothetical protein n=1 Tax=Saccharopolyspora sp. NFXS83 TaxID=2993560 RepID=UPI00224B95B2|nr:hypothetical protein [Saccharopolyspora sp. NFXS83]MCX2733857.1 hypothetical protein [Saccharopolyspora sp. NFXS83]